MQRGGAAARQAAPANHDVGISDEPDGDVDFVTANDDRLGTAHEIVPVLRRRDRPRGLDQRPDEVAGHRATPRVIGP